MEGWWEKLETSTRPAAMKLKNIINDNLMRSLHNAHAKNVRHGEFPDSQSLSRLEGNKGGDQSPTDTV